MDGGAGCLQFIAGTSSSDFSKPWVARMAIKSRSSDPPHISTSSEYSAYSSEMTHHDHDHHHDHSELSETELRVRALETILTEKGYIDPAALDLLIETYETKWARATASVWWHAPGAIPLIRARLLRDATAAIAGVRLCRPAGRGHGRRREHASPSTTWSSARCAPATRGRCSGCRRSGTNRRPTARARSWTRAAVLREFGFDVARRPRCAFGTQHAEMRYLVLPQRPAGTEGWSEERLAELVTRDSMIGTGLPRQPHEVV